MSAFGKALQADPFVDDPSREPELAGDRSDGLTGVIHGPDLGEGREQERTSRYVGQFARLAVIAVTPLRTIGIETPTRIGAVAADGALQPAQLAFNSGPQVLHQVEAIGDLLRLRGALTRCVGVEPITITRDQLDAGSLG